MSATLSSPFGGDVAALQDATRDETSLRRFLHGLPGVDQVGAEARAAALATRSIKTTSKAWALDTAIRMVDLTTLEGADTPGKVRSLSAKAMRPDPSDPTTPPVAAVCVYPDLVEVAVEALRGSQVHVASVATAFPSGRAALATKLADVRDAIKAGADEIDMVIDRGAFLAGRYGQVFDEIVAVRGGTQLHTLLDCPFHAIEFENGKQQSEPGHGDGGNDLAQFKFDPAVGNAGNAAAPDIFSGCRILI